MKIIYLISGHPKHGKTTIANNFDCMLLSLDELFWLFYNEFIEKNEESTFSVYGLFQNFTQKQIDNYKEEVFKRINNFIESEENELVIDGWLLDFYKDEIIKTFSFINFVDIKIFNYCAYIDGIKFENKTESEIKTNLVGPLKLYSAKKILSNRITYHYYEDLKLGNIYQKSLEKYNSFDIDRLIKDKIVLDAGCNTGYNCFKMSENAKEVIGVDINNNAIDTSLILNKLIYKKNNIQFIKSSILEHKRKYDVILASSIFHYFANQKEFLNKCCNLLNENGILVLELGLNTSDKSIVVRKDGCTCYYPTITELYHLAENLDFLFYQDSVNQIGDENPRMVYHLKKK